MKKYGALATLIIVSTLTVLTLAFKLVAAQGASELTVQPARLIWETNSVTPEREKAADVRREERKRMFELIEAQPVYRPELFVKDGGTNGTQIIMVTTNRIGGPLTRRYDFGALNAQPEDYQTGAAKLVTPVSESHRPFMVFVLTSIDFTNWYPVSFGQTFPESKQPRYFMMWTEIDSLNLHQERLDKIMAGVGRTNTFGTNVVVPERSIRF
jgi:hypothetical protein